MTILVTGGGGQLAGAIRDRDPAAVLLGRGEADVTDAASVRAAIERHRPDVLINCAAYNAVDRAEEEPEAAFRVNAIGPRTLAAACRTAGVDLIHVSTDYVFGGDADRRTPLREGDRPAPLSAYGVSKLAGEQFVLAADPSFAVIRTCGLYGRRGGNFVRTMLRLAESREEVSVVDDQRCTPTNCADLAGWLLELAGGRAGGLIHATNDGETTWAGFAAAVFEAAGLPIRVEPITSAQFGAKAARPPYSVLACDRVPDRRHWRDAVTEFVAAERADAD